MADPLMQALHRLRDAPAQSDVLNALWDLRDLAFATPQPWHGITAETLLQALAEAVEDIPADDRDGLRANRLLAHAFEKVLFPK